MENLSTAKEVQDLYEDLERFGPVNDGENWFVTKAWANKFKHHLQKLLPLAEQGDALAQCEVANIYYVGYLHPSEDEALNCYQSDIETATTWWLKSIHGGVYSALDALMVSGVGAETDRLRKIYKENLQEFTQGSPPSEDWEKDMKHLYAIAYKNS